MSGALCSERRSAGLNDPPVSVQTTGQSQGISRILRKLRQT
jgi:hypothetical protein